MSYCNLKKKKKKTLPLSGQAGSSGHLVPLTILQPSLYATNTMIVTMPSSASTLWILSIYLSLIQHLTDPSGHHHSLTRVPRMDRDSREVLLGNGGIGLLLSVGELKQSLLSTPCLNTPERKYPRTPTSLFPETLSL